MVYCDSRKMTKTVPRLPNQFKYSREQTVDGDTTHLRDVIYDGLNKLIKYEMRPSYKSETEFFVTDSLKIIYDYNIGMISFLRNFFKKFVVVVLVATALDRKFLKMFFSEKLEVL